MSELSHSKPADVIRHDFYVDDLLSGAACVENLQTIKSEVSQILESVGFELTWIFVDLPSQADNDFRVWHIQNTWCAEWR